MRIFFLLLVLHAITSLKIGDLKTPIPVYSERNGEFSRILKDSMKLLYLASVVKIGQRECNARESIEAKYAIGYEAAESAFSPLQSLYATPFLPQSAILNRTPIENELVGQLQAFLESFVQLLNPSSAQLSQLNKNDSVLWNNLRINAQRAAGMFVYNRDLLLPYISTEDSEEIQLLRKQFGYQKLDEFQQNVIKLVSVSRQSNITQCVALMKATLNSLCTIAYLQVPMRSSPSPSSSSSSSSSSNSASAMLLEEEKEREEKDRIFLSNVDLSERFLLPRLRGQATVRVTFQRPGPSSISSPSDAGDRSTMKILVDGINYPYTGGNFVDLCLKKYYDNQPVAYEQIDFDNGQIANFTVIGLPTEEYVDPLTGRPRRIPLEILREEDDKIRYTAIGAARNTPIFTNAKPVQSFATVGSVGMFHSKGDRNGASVSIFFPQVDRKVPVSKLNELPVVQRLNNKYSLFAYAIDGEDVIDRLRPGDIIDSVTVEPGTWMLYQPDPDGRYEVIPAETTST